MTIFGTIAGGALFLTGVVAGIYLSEKHGVTCADVRKLGQQAMSSTKRASGRFRIQQEPLENAIPI